MIRKRKKEETFFTVLHEDATKDDNLLDNNTFQHTLIDEVIEKLDSKGILWYFR